MDVDAAATLKRIASLLATNWRQTYSGTFRYIKSRISIILVWATHRCIWGSRLTAHKISVHCPQWEYCAWLNLFI